MSVLRGQTLSLKSEGVIQTVSWKQGSFLGMGGDCSQEYRFCTYTTGSGTEVPVYIQKSYTVPKKLTVDRELQFGMQEGVLFYVFHDKTQTPYQHRFKSNDLQKVAYAANSILKMTKGVDISWIAGDYLRNID